jgi:small subunit ribosomal protein S1
VIDGDQVASMNAILMELPWDDEYWQVVVGQGEEPNSEAWTQEARLTWERNDASGWEGADFDQTDIELRTTPPIARQQCWNAAHDMMSAGQSVTLQATGYNRGGLLVQWSGLQGFVPASHLVGMPRIADPDVRRQYLASRLGTALELRVIEIDEGRDRLVFSERAATTAVPTDPLAALLPGARCQGRVSTICDFGVFVDLGGFEGLVHISELSWGRVRSPADLVQLGQQIDVMILAVDPRSRKVALSVKQLQSDPWSHAASSYQVGQTVTGRVTNIVSFGAFVELEEGIEGLVHISELAEGTFMHPRNVVREGEIVAARVVSVDVGNHRLGLSLRQAQQGEPPPLA